MRSVTVERLLQLAEALQVRPADLLEEKQARDVTAPAFAMVPLAALRDRRLGLRDLRVLGVLYGYANADGVCWPSRAAIAEATGLPVTRVSEVTARLVRLGWLRKSHEGRTVTALNQCRSRRNKSATTNANPANTAAISKLIAGPNVAQV